MIKKNNCYFSQAAVLTLNFRCSCLIWSVTDVGLTQDVLWSLVHVFRNKRVFAIFLDHTIAMFYFRAVHSWLSLKNVDYCMLGEYLKSMFNMNVCINVIRTYYICYFVIIMYGTTNRALSLNSVPALSQEVNVYIFAKFLWKLPIIVRRASFTNERRHCNHENDNLVKTGIKQCIWCSQLSKSPLPWSIVNDVIGYPYARFTHAVYCVTSLPFINPLPWIV